MRHYTQILEDLLSDPRKVLLALIAASIAILGAALYFQYIEGLHPCRMCLYQRWPYGGVIVLSLAGLLLQRYYRVILTLNGIILNLGAVIAVYHVGLEQNWWEEVISCAPPQAGGSFEDILKSLEQPYVPCDKVPWSLFGLSMAAYNALLSLGLAGACFAAAKYLRRNKAL